MLYVGSVVFLLFSLTFIAAILYLPHHIAILVGRAWYYINGEHVDIAASAKEVVQEITSSILLQGSSSTVKAAIIQETPVLSFVKEL